MSKMQTVTFGPCTISLDRTASIDENRGEEKKLEQTSASLVTTVALQHLQLARTSLSIQTRQNGVKKICQLSDKISEQLLLQKIYKNNF